MEHVTTPRTPNSDPWVEVARSDTYKVLHPLLEKSSVRLPPLLLWKDIQPQRFANAGKQG